MAMRLNSQLSNLLEAYDLERLNALLLWLNSEVQDMFSPTTSVMDAQQAVEAANLETSHAPDLALNDLVRFSIVDEFGPAFIAKNSFSFLSDQVCRRIQTHNVQ